MTIRKIIIWTARGLLSLIALATLLYMILLAYIVLVLPVFGPLFGTIHESWARDTGWPWWSLWGSIILALGIIIGLLILAGLEDD